MSDMTLDDMLVMADLIAQRMDAGKLPAQNESGQYVFSPSDLALG